MYLTYPLSGFLLRSRSRACHSHVPPGTFLEERIVPLKGLSDSDHRRRGRKQAAGKEKKNPELVLVLNMHEKTLRGHIYIHIIRCCAFLFLPAPARLTWYQRLPLALI